MNLSNLIIAIQEKLDSSVSSLDVMTYAKIIEKLKIGNVNVVKSFNDLPSLVDDGNVFVIEDEFALYYNVGNDFISLGNISDNVTYAWGYGSFGRLGDGTTVNRSSPVTVVGGVTNWSQVSAGGYHGIGVTDTGIAYAWGYGGEGQLGDEASGFSNTKSSPVTVVGGITNWSQVSAGGSHSLGLTADGIAYAWGYGSFGRLGDGTTINKSSPVTVVGGITNWSQVSAGGQHSLGLTADGIAYAWGNGSFGRLGDGTTVNKSSPVTVVGGITNWSQVSAGGGHSLGVTDTGIAYAWGYGGQGRLGDGTGIDKSSPVTVVGGITNWSQVSAGNTHSLGLTADGIAYAWGSGSQGLLGDGTTVSRSSPVTVVGGITNWSQVSAGNTHSLGVTATGIAYAWGSGSFGRLGDGTGIDKSSPVTVVGGITNWSQVSGAGNMSIAVQARIKTFTKT